VVFSCLLSLFIISRADGAGNTTEHGRTGSRIIAAGEGGSSDSNSVRRGQLRVAGAEMMRTVQR
jgi:hypothetical protein